MTRCFSSNTEGSVAAEFAIVVPVLLILIFGLFQIDILYFANAGLQNAIGEGARTATLFPRKTDAEIVEHIKSKAFGLNPSYLETPTVTHGVDYGLDFIDIHVSYRVKINMYPLNGVSITLENNRRVYLP